MLDLGGAEIEDLAFVDLDQQKAIAYFEQQRVTFFILFIDVPIFDGLVVHSEEGLRNGLPRDGLVAGGETGAGESSEHGESKNRGPNPQGPQGETPCGSPGYKRGGRFLRGMKKIIAAGHGYIRISEKDLSSRAMASSTSPLEIFSMGESRTTLP